MCIDKETSIGEDNEASANSLDFCRIFASQLNSLYKLALLLTTNHCLAEQCALASLDEALTVNKISKASAESWSKRAIIRNSLRMVCRDSLEVDISLQPLEGSKHQLTDWPFSAVLSLKPLERFVFVLSVLEKLPDWECSQLLGCAFTEIAPARIRALECLAMFDASEKEQFTSRPFAPVCAYSSAMSLGRDQATSMTKSAV